MYGNSSRLSAGQKLAACVAVALLVITGGYVIRSLYVGYWTLQQSNANHQADVVQHSYNVQNGYQAAITKDVAAVDGDIALINGGDPNSAALHVQAINAGNNACAYALKLIPSAMPVPDDMAAWIKGNCSVGALSLNSPIRNGNGN